MVVPRSGGVGGKLGREEEILVAKKTSRLSLAAT